MMARRYILLLLSMMTAAGLKAQNLSNRGKEFWVAWGHNAVDATFLIYVYAELETTVTISIPGSSFTPVRNRIGAGEVRTYALLDNSYKINTQGIITGKAIHIECDQPVAAYAHQFAEESSGATMLFPVETYGQTYYSLNPDQYSNMENCHSWFYAIATEDNTRIEVKPSANTLSVPAGDTRVINLNKGQVYNLFGVIGTDPADMGLKGVDLTGSSIKSVPGNDGVCHPIACFSGSSRVILLNGSGGDVVQQQIFPARAWGTRYLTAPTVNTNDVNLNNDNVYRVAVRSPGTVVKRNGTVLTGLTRNFYYEFTSNKAEYIEADGQILVAQCIPSNLHTLGFGDPEMMYISPLEQGIKSTRFNATEHEYIQFTYLNAIVPAAGAASLKVDGSTTWDREYPHPGLPGYIVKIKKFTPFQSVHDNGLTVGHSISCDTTFTAITYGLGSFESYGYNAGTLINNLEVYTGISNKWAVRQDLVNTTCAKSPFRFHIKMGYKANRIEWQLAGVNGIQPARNEVVNEPEPYDSVIELGRKYYFYSLPVDFSFNTTGNYEVPVKVYAELIDNCDRSMLVNTRIEVKQGSGSVFTVAYTGCRYDEAVFTGTAKANGFNLTRYAWDFEDGSTDSSKNTLRYFPVTGNHPVRYTVIADNGCLNDTAINVVTYPNPTAGITVTPPVAFAGDPVTFTGSSYFGGKAAINTWYWYLGTGTPFTTTANTPQTNTYITAGTYTIRYAATVSTCASDTVTRTIVIMEKLDRVELPNAFSPNGDGVHDTWEIPQLQSIPDVVIKIFNRWGQEVFRSQGYVKPWDGRFNNQPLPSGTYYYHIQTSNSAHGKRTGAITLIR